MKKFIITLFIVWRISLELIAGIARFILPVRTGFLGPYPWANFDGVHYLSIAQNGYFEFQQAFFPMYPLLMRSIGNTFLNNSYYFAGMAISNISIIGCLFLIWKLAEQVRIEGKKLTNEQIKQTLIFLMFAPTGFYFGSVYTESFFLLLTLLSFYFLAHNQKILFGISASIASATKVIGALLLVPIGLIAYMLFLWQRYHDPLLFLHAQPAFGSNRSGGELIFLPQVYWRYLKILFTVPLVQYDYWIALYELFMFHAALFLLWLSWKKKLPEKWIWFSLAAIISPTLTGSLSSMPRYVLAAFPIFFILGSLKGWARKIALGISLSLFIISTVLFTRGYWIS